MKPFDDSYRLRDNEVRARHGLIWNDTELIALGKLYTSGASLEEMCNTLARGADGTLSKLVCIKCILPNRNGPSYSTSYMENPQVPRARPEIVTVSAPSARISTQPQPQPQPQPETITMSTPNIETKTFIAGVDAANMSDEEIFSRILKIENQIKGYDVIANKPKKLQAVMQKLTEDVGALVAFVDART